MHSNQEEKGQTINKIWTTDRGLRGKSEIYASYQNVFQTDQRAKVKCQKKTQVSILERRNVCLCDKMRQEAKILDVTPQKFYLT